MDCVICCTTPILPILKPPRNTICAACYEGARTVIALMDNLAIDSSDEKGVAVRVRSNNNSLQLSTSTSIKPLANLPKWMINMKEIEEELNEKISFLSGFISLFRQQILTDIKLKPGNDEPPIPAHRALLASRSEIFKNMLDSDDACKTPASDTISFQELSHEELECLLEFLYCGSLTTEKIERHVYSLAIAADKYEIPYLLKFCERRMLTSLDSSNALDVLEVSDVCSNTTLKESALSFIVKNMEDVVFSHKYDAFASKNPHLGLEITRAYFIDSKSRRN
ncbi:BTB/POZ domain-containing protein At3g56230 isoform X1 [Tripterygium wilfordii]|uniref:BTB/POZ domain-containing protein At3g56230 isoform X1 n=1 Tax=Tripterygium wilfordii TaxID=458696 RepID=UPI0018F8368A|nr:BTB/POZ domain-containing protein At3g56230 isoform X1 [Tripterygium wilfordii]